MEVRVRAVSGELRPQHSACGRSLPPGTMVGRMTEEITLSHVRRPNKECVGYLRMIDDGWFVLIDLLGNDVAGPMNLSHAGELLEELALSCLAEQWWPRVTYHS